MAINLDSPPSVFAVVAMSFFKTTAGARNAPSIFGALKRKQLAPQSSMYAVGKTDCELGILMHP